MLLRELPFGADRAFAIAFGLLWGSFLNVVIYRVPRELSVVRPGSRCPACGKPIPAYDNIPVLSFLVLRGRARCCGAKMSPRYLLVELLGGIASWGVIDGIIGHLPGSVSLLRASGIYLADFALVMGLIAAAFIDWEHMYLPEPITVGGAILGLATAPLRQMGFGTSLVGGVVGFLVVWLPFIVLYKRVRGFAGMGMGDAKLLMLAGAWFGWFGAVFVLLAGAVQGSVGALVLYLIKGKLEDPESVKKDIEELKAAAAAGDAEAKSLLEDDPASATDEDGNTPPRIAFGPFLILAVLEYLFFGDRILAIMASLYAV